MDPNATLAEIRSIVADPEHATDNRHRLAELVEALDEWLSKGGFLPDAWQQMNSRGPVGLSGGRS